MEALYRKQFGSLVVNVEFPFPCFCGIPAQPQTRSESGGTVPVDVGLLALGKGSPHLGRRQEGIGSEAFLQD